MGPGVRHDGRSNDGIHCIVLTGGGAIFLIYLLRSGVAIAGALVAPALILLGRFVVCPAKCSLCALRFHVAVEGGWEVGGASGLLAAALALSLGMLLAAGVLLAMAGVSATIGMLRRN